MNAAVTNMNGTREPRSSRFSGFWCRRNVASFLCWLSATWAIPVLLLSCVAVALAAVGGFLGTPVDAHTDYGDHGVIAVVALLWLLIIGVLCLALALWLVGFLIGRSVPKGERGARVRFWGLMALTAVVIADATLWFLSCRLLLARFGLSLGLGEFGSVGSPAPTPAVGALVFLAITIGLAFLLAWETGRGRPVEGEGSVTCEEPAVSHKSRRTALVLCLFLGAFGAHRYYIGKVGTGTVMLLLGVVGVPLLIVGGPLLIVVVWALVDLVKIATGNMRDIDGRQITEWRVKSEAV